MLVCFLKSTQTAKCLMAFCGSLTLWSAYVSLCQHRPTNQANKIGPTSDIWITEMCCIEYVKWIHTISFSSQWLSRFSSSGVFSGFSGKGFSDFPGKAGKDGGTLPDIQLQTLQGKHALYHCIRSVVLKLHFSGFKKWIWIFCTGTPDSSIVGTLFTIPDL